jgi:spore germination cell wall hydrolase CwlJ-like protein
MARLVPDWAWGVMTLFQEAQGCDHRERVMIAEVILRRTKLRYQSDGTVAGTVLWPMQFSGWNAKDDTPQYRERVEAAKLDLDNPIAKACLDAWREADEQETNYSCGAVLYYNPKICAPGWAAKCTEVARTKYHVYMVERRKA